MKNCIFWMIVGCLLVLVATAVLPRFGVQLAGGPLFAILMVLCCMGPMLLAGLGSKGGSGCCSKEPKNGGERAEDTSKSGGACH
jgi:hypothetical protein